MQLFLTRLSQYLNASLSRRQQLVALRTAFATPKHAALDFRVFNNASSDRVIVEWDLSPRGAGNDDAGDDDSGDGVGPEQHLVAVQAAFCDLRHADIAADDLLVRFVERRAGAGACVGRPLNLRVPFTLCVCADLPSETNRTGTGVDDDRRPLRGGWGAGRPAKTVGRSRRDISRAQRWRRGRGRRLARWWSGSLDLSWLKLISICNEFR